MTVETADTRRVERARVAVGATFTINGFAVASWIARVPAARDDLGLSAAQLGLLLLCMSVGSVLALAERFERVHLDTTMFATDFTEQFAPFDRADLPRLAALRDKVLLGTDFPSIPYPYAHQLAALHRLDLGEDWLRAVLWGNGARLFGLSEPFARLPA